LDANGLYEKILGFVGDKGTHRVMYVNAHCVGVSRRDKEYRRILNSADLLYVDGISLVWTAGLLGQNVPCRLTAADFMPFFFNRFARNGVRVYLLGAKPGVAEVMASRLRKKNGEIQIVGTHHGFFEQWESEKIVEEINKSNADIVMVGMGVPYQEKWIEAHYKKIDARVIWGVGALFDFFSGNLPRGPQWLLDAGFEWLCRLVSEPRRLWRRYLVGNFLFVLHVMQWKTRAHRKDADSAEAR
jgi:N-acetylglucosaminyldiphosphoundecaprenol N-acetyl-beta-D-mannosaminyltransferase